MNVIAVVIVAWLIGSFVVNAPFPAIATQVNNSAVLRTVDRVMPHGALYLPVFPQLRSLLSNGLYTQVFSAIGAENGLNLAAPDPAVLTSRALARVEPSIVKIEGVAASCSLRIEGSGFVISPQTRTDERARGRRGHQRAPRLRQRRARVYRGHVVLYDSQRDLAVIDVPGLTAPPLTFAPQAGDGTSAIVAGYPLDHPLTVVAARIGHIVTAYGPNIYQTTVVHRQIYPIRAQIEPGNSGGPLLSRSGRVYGVVFAASTSIKDRGYALTGAEVASDVGGWQHGHGAVSTAALPGAASRRSAAAARLAGGSAGRPPRARPGRPPRCGRPARRTAAAGRRRPPSCGPGAG